MTNTAPTQNAYANFTTVQLTLSRDNLVRALDTLDETTEREYRNELALAATKMTEELYRRFNVR